ncbi:MAG: hypothetical protein QM775_28450 [Pirellulales bacterium]
MNRIRPTNAIPTNSILDREEAQAELSQRGWSVGHVVIDGIHQVGGYKQDARIIAEAPNETAAWLLACDKANEQERIWKDRN